MFRMFPLGRGGGNASGRAATDDINVQCVFNNAGFIVTGFFESSPEEKQMANLECNATASAKVPYLPSIDGAVVGASRALWKAP